MDVVDEGAQGGKVGGDRGDRKVVTTNGGDRDSGVTVRSDQPQPQQQITEG